MGSSFNPREHLITIKNKQGASEYLPVQWRLVWFRQECPEGTIETELVHLDVDKEMEEELFVWNAEKRRSEKVVKTAKGMAIFRAVVKDGKGGMATATKMEKAASFPDYLEKAETSAIGRALAALGYGTQFTGEELDESHRIVDSPVNSTELSTTSASSALALANEGSAVPARAENPSSFTTRNGNGGNANTTASNLPQQVANASIDQNAQGSITEQQLNSIHKLCEHLSKSEPANVSKLSFLEARQVIRQLTTEYKEMRQNTKAS